MGVRESGPYGEVGRMKNFSTCPTAHTAHMVAPVVSCPSMFASRHGSYSSKGLHLPPRFDPIVTAELGKHDGSTAHAHLLFLHKLTRAMDPDAAPAAPAPAPSFGFGFGASL